ncbi:MAG: hypothetical protein II266_06495 [Clostridia bacterium]|nr:hypothetical protein [Clostridia bacterium]
MRLKGKWHGAPFRDYSIRKVLITLALEEYPEIYDTTQEKDITIEIKEWRAKRSLNANAYFHVLVDKIAEKIGESHTETHNQLIADYGEPDTEVGIIILEARVDWRKVEAMHLRPIPGQTQELANGKTYQAHQVMRGSHTYDTKEMARLIDGTIYEAKQLEIETMTPDEIERMKAAWQG